MSHNKTYEELLDLFPDDLRNNFEEISAGKRLLELYEDLSFKKIFDPDLHQERLSKLIRLIFKCAPGIESSLKNEISKASVFSKKTILDVLVKLSNGGICDLEMQAAAQEYIATRVEVYTCDMVMMQYSVSNEMKKGEFEFTDIPVSYFILIMKNSPSLFKNNLNFIHYKQTITDTGIKLPTLINTVYIELEKCYTMYMDGCFPPEQEELCRWLCLIADINHSDHICGLEFDQIRQELRLFGQDKEALMSILSEKYADAIYYTDINLAKKEGKRVGIREGIREGQEGLNELNKYLIAQGRMEDLYRSVCDKQYQEELLEQHKKDAEGTISR